MSLRIGETIINTGGGGGGGNPDYKSITKNASDKLQTIGVIDNNDSTTAIKTWTGTLAEYNAIETKDNDTTYYITDDQIEVYSKAEVDALLDEKVINNNTITLTQDTVIKGSFTLNQDSDTTIDLSVAVDNSTITKTSEHAIQSVGIINENSGTTKFWTGTLAEYNAIETKNPNTIYNITDDENNNITDVIYQNSSRNVGDIFYTTRTDTALNGAVRCNGNTYQTTDFTGNNNIGTLLRNDRVSYVSLDEYEVAVSTYGYCKSFGWDGGVTTSFKVPTLPDMPLGEIPVNFAATDTITDLTNSPIWKKTDGTVLSNGHTIAALGGAGTSIFGSTNGENNGNNTITNAYADLTTSNSYHAYVQLYNGVSESALSTCTSVSSDVSDMNEHKVIAFQRPTAENSYTWYRKYADGWVEQGGTIIANNDAAYTQILPVIMANTGYQVLITRNPTGDTTSTLNQRWHEVYNITTTTFTTWGKYYNHTTIFWEVKGMYAEE